MTWKQLDDTDMKFFELIVSNSVISFKDTVLYHGGDTGTDFFDIDVITGNSDSQSQLLDVIQKYIARMSNDGLEYDKIALIHKDMGPIGLITYGSQLSKLLDKELVMVKRWRNLREDDLRVKGAKLEEEDSVLLIDDVVTTGATQKSAIDAIENKGATVSGLLTLFTRNWDVLEDISGVKDINYLESVVTHDELEYVGIALPENPEKYFRSNFIRRYIHMMGEGEQAEQMLEEDVEDAITKLLEKHELSTEDTSKDALKNLYFNLSAFALRDKLYTDKSKYDQQLESK